MKLGDKIYVAGHRGLVGSALLRKLQERGYENFVTRTHAELDLCDQTAVRSFFAKERPAYVLLAAAKVGGIHANNTYPADFIFQNLAVQNNVIHAAYKHDAKKLLFLGSSCIYPKHAPQPMKEEHLMSGPLEPTNAPYAMAKLAGIEMCASYNRQYGTNFVSVLPTNLYGPGDNYDLENSHFVPALMRKMHEAKLIGATQVSVWGTGMPRRELLYSDDLADACVFLMEHVDATRIGNCVNVGSGVDHTIAELALQIAETVQFRGELVYDTARPDGTPKKLLDVSRMRELGWEASVGLADGLRRAYDDFRQRTESMKGNRSAERGSFSDAVEARKHP